MISRKLLALAFLAALAVVGEVVSTYVQVSEVGAVGGTGYRTVTRSYLVVGSVELRHGTVPGVESTTFDRVVVGMWVVDAAAAGRYEVVVVVRNDGEVYAVTLTVTVTTTPTTHNFLLPRTVTQRSLVDVEVSASRLG